MELKFKSLPITEKQKELFTKIYQLFFKYCSKKYGRDTKHMSYISAFLKIIELDVLLLLSAEKDPDYFIELMQQFAANIEDKLIKLEKGSA